MASGSIRLNHQKQSNPNLLDNWYFVGGGSQQGGGQLPVNTRGKTSYASAVQYTIDRWKTSNANTTVSLQSSRLQISASSGSTPYLVQRLANADAFLGKTVTLSVLQSSGLKCKTVTLPSSNPGSTTTYADIANVCDILYSSNTWSVRIKGASGGTANIIAAKLELGNTQTLTYCVNGTWVLNDIPRYGEERLRCMRSLADSTDVYSYNPNAPVWSTPANVSTNASGEMAFPSGVTFNNLISVYQEKPSNNYDAIIAVPFMFQTTPLSSGVYVYGISGSSISLLTNISTGKLTFVYRL